MCQACSSACAAAVTDMRNVPTARTTPHTPARHEHHAAVSPAAMIPICGVSMYILATYSCWDAMTWCYASFTPTRCHDSHADTLNAAMTAKQARPMQQRQPQRYPCSSDNHAAPPGSYGSHACSEPSMQRQQSCRHATCPYHAATTATHQQAGTHAMHKSIYNSAKCPVNSIQEFIAPVRYSIFH
jgi:hypothetical protein